MLQAAVCDGGELNTLAFGKDRLRSAEVDVGRCKKRSPVDRIGESYLLA